MFSCTHNKAFNLAFFHVICKIFLILDVPKDYFLMLSVSPTKNVENHLSMGSVKDSLVWNVFAHKFMRTNQTWEPIQSIVWHLFSFAVHVNNCLLT